MKIIERISTKFAVKIRAIKNNSPVPITFPPLCQVSYSLKEEPGRPFESSASLGGGAQGVPAVTGVGVARMKSRAKQMAAAHAMEQLMQQGVAQAEFTKPGQAQARKRQQQHKKQVQAQGEKKGGMGGGGGGVQKEWVQDRTPLAGVTKGRVGPPRGINCRGSFQDRRLGRSVSDGRRFRPGKG